MLSPRTWSHMPVNVVNPGVFNVEGGSQGHSDEAPGRPEGLPGMAGNWPSLTP